MTSGLVNHQEWVQKWCKPGNFCIKRVISQKFPFISDLIHMFVWLNNSCGGGVRVCGGQCHRHPSKVFSCFQFLHSWFFWHRRAFLKAPWPVLLSSVSTVFTEEAPNIQAARTSHDSGSSVSPPPPVLSSCPPRHHKSPSALVEVDLLMNLWAFRNLFKY